MTILQAIQQGERLLQDHGIQEARWNAEQVVIIVLSTSRTRIYSEPGIELSEVQLQSLEEGFLRRANHYPLAYLEGKQEFLGHDFVVNENVLIPRPETQEIVRGALAVPLPPNPRVLDIGTGSGILAITLSRLIETSEMFVMEISTEALAVFRFNSQRSIPAVQGDLFQCPFLSESFDLIVSNPPYVEERELRELPPETLWEPRVALVASSLERVYRSLLQQAGRILKPGGFLIFEIGFGQRERIEALCAQHSQFQILDIRVDDAGIPRTFVLIRI
ncbi:MAG TPA: peptide chain release factor N(5)-glutamine methyltransferase [Acidobacteriota bacterium]|nr:peptide chain release factor N(5)-glutamine methyltransferase [Acidobacteriota bacterium]